MEPLTYQRRLVDSLLAELLQDLPAISLLGPRGSGKTTTAIRHAKTVVRLNEPDQANLFRASPDVALRGLAEPVLLDEWQEVPQVLGAVKRAVDAESRNGRFILTGSVRAELDVATWPGTGRVVDIDMTTLTMRERVGDPGARTFLDRIADDDLTLPTWVRGFDLRDYVDLALQGGFPDAALGATPETRRRWFTGYIRQITTRDAQNVSAGRDPRRLARFLAALAHSTAAVVSEKTLWEAAEIDAKTAASYENLLCNLFVLDVVPAWYSNRLKRLASRPKRYLVDTGLAAALMRVDRDAVLWNSDLLGRMIDTFVAAQLRAELSVAESEPTMCHLRQRDGREVDLIIEYGLGRIVGIEVKPTSAPKQDDGRHLAWLRDKLGDRFIRGLVMHTGQGCYELGERILAVPIAAIWT